MRSQRAGHGSRCGAALNRELPGQPAVGSCVSCDGEPVDNRNSVLRRAAGADLVSKTIAAVACMGYLRQQLSDADIGDISAHLATVVPAGPLDLLPEPWPTADDFGAQTVGTQSSARVVLIRNLQPRTDIAIGAVLASDPLAFPVQHNCPVSLPPLGQAARREITLINTSAAGVTLATLRITGPDASLFTLGACCAPTDRLDGMASCTVVMQFAPSSACRAEGWIEIASDASNAPLVRIAAARLAAPAVGPVASAPTDTGSGRWAMSAGWVAILLAVVAQKLQRGP